MSRPALGFISKLDQDLLAGLTSQQTRRIYAFGEERLPPLEQVWPRWIRLAAQDGLRQIGAGELEDLPHGWQHAVCWAVRALSYWQRARRGSVAPVWRAPWARISAAPAPAPWRSCLSVHAPPASGPGQDERPALGLAAAEASTAKQGLRREV